MQEYTCQTSAHVDHKYICKKRKREFSHVLAKTETSTGLIILTEEDKKKCHLPVFHGHIYT